MHIPTLVFTDLDGTLLDSDSYSWRGARSALTELRRRRVPVILCTSKTRAEVRYLRDRIGITDPYAAENGGVIVVPRGFSDHAILRRGKQRDLVFRLGGEHADILETLKGLARATEVSVRGFSDMSAAELARETGLPLAQARLALRRESGEPFLFQDAPQKQIRLFARMARERGFTLQRGGRFWHLSAGCDKGQAVQILTDLYQLAWTSPVRVIALGDAANDLPMLRRAHVPILLANRDGRFDPVVTKALPQIRRVSETSPAGWGQAVLQAIRECQTKNRHERAASRPRRRARAAAAGSLS
jgi:mannosyl-3-phosphoglycerate phosphatase